MLTLMWSDCKQDPRKQNKKYLKKSGDGQNRFSWPKLLVQYLETTRTQCKQQRGGLEPSMHWGSGGGSQALLFNEVERSES